MARLPNSENAILDIRKIADYCLSPVHPRGRHKARLFRDLLGINQSDASWLWETLLESVQHNDAFEIATDVYGSRWRGCPDDATRKERCGKNHLDCAQRRERASLRDVLGALMAERGQATIERPALLDAVALLSDRPEPGLARGQVGTVVEILDDKTVLVEFSDDDGRAYAVTPCPPADLLVLHYMPEAV
jgi:hypothetical protein